MQASNDEPRQAGTHMGTHTAACADAIRDERQKHQQELSALRAHYEAKLGERQSECRPCEIGHALNFVDIIAEQGASRHCSEASIA
jgi:hypothetical protein